MAKSYDRIETDNPLLDEIVYNCKLLMSSCILKDEKSADNAETVESLKNANIYIAITEGRCKFEYFSYSYQDFLDAGILPSYIDGYMEDNSTIPDGIKNILLKNKISEFEYTELNNYYRKLSGLPNIEDNNYVYLTQDDTLVLPITININIPVHTFSDSIKYLLEDYGIIDDLIERYPSKYYLKYLNKHIDPYNARKADKFGLIYANSNIESLLLTRFKELVEKNRVYIIKTMDFDAYDFYSDYYDRFLMMMIIVQTVVDMVNELPEYYIRKDLFDIRTIEYFFEANGVEFFPTIPLKYQKILVQNLNRLIKYKATTTNIVDICSLFGFSNIEIFKYYLCKTRNQNMYGGYINSGNVEEDYDLKFLKVPLNNLADETAKDQSNFLMYDTVIAKDPYWNGPYTRDYVKGKILEHEFNMVRSKYISIDTVYSLTDATFELSYFINMLMFNNISKEQLNFIIPSISTLESINLVDAFIFLYALMYKYNGSTDNIITTPSGYLKIKGFNFQVNMTALGEYVLEKGYTLKDLGVAGFQIPNGGILSFNQLISIFINNKNIYDHIIHEMDTTDDKEIYKIYKYIYDSLMLTDLNFEYYYVSQLGRTAETYTEFLQYKKPILYNLIQNIDAEEDATKKSQNIYDVITDIASFITDYIGSDELTHIFINLPTESGEYIKGYMYKIINFFKSYKISILDIQTIYKLDKENKISIFDDIFYQYYFVKTQIIDMIESKQMITNMSKEDIMKLADDYTYNSLYNSLELIKTDEKTAGVTVSITYTQLSEIVDKFKSMISTLNKSDSLTITDEKYRYFYVYNQNQPVDMIDSSILKSIYNSDDLIVLAEIMDMLRVYHRDYMESINSIDTLDFTATITKPDNVNIEDIVFINPVY